jgi:hypothetical protein
MDLIERLRELSARIPQQLEHIETEEATKNALIMPFMSALGYDVFNPLEILPEFTADIGIKKGEKVDYAVKKDQQIIMLIECKFHKVNLAEEHTSQLYRYFSVTEARFGIITNGIIYQFFSDIDEPNKMDSKPFFEFNILNFQPHHIKELNKFTKSAFSLEEILNTASNLKYTGAIKKILEEELESPSENFVKFFATQIYTGKVTKVVINQFVNIVKDSAKQLITEKINDLIESAINKPIEQTKEVKELPIEEKESNNGIVTTQEEIDGFNIVRGILSQVIDLDKVTMRDTKSYCGILFDDNNRKPICRLYFNTSQKYLALFSNKKETKIPINNLTDIFNYHEELKATIIEYSS